MEKQTLDERINALREQAESARASAALNAGGTAMSMLTEIAAIPLPNDVLFITGKILMLVGGVLMGMEAVSSSLESAQAGREAAALMTAQAQQQ